MINIEFTGKFPNLCDGGFIIYRDNIEIYKVPERCFLFHGGYATLKWRISSLNEKQRMVGWLLDQPDMIEIANEFDKAMKKINQCCGGCS